VATYVEALASWDPSKAVNFAAEMKSEELLAKALERWRELDGAAAAKWATGRKESK
jgi:hypothetical protein